MGGCCGSKHRPSILVRRSTIVLVKTKLIILSEQNGSSQENYSNQLLKDDLTIFQNKEQLQKHIDDDTNNILIVCCKSLEKIQQVRSISNFHSFAKIGIAYDYNLQNIQRVKQDLQKQIGFRFCDIFKDNFVQINGFFKKACEKDSLYFCHRNIGMINRAWITFDYFFQRKLDPNDYQRFLLWAEQSMGNQFKDTTNELIQRLLIVNFIGENEIFTKTIDILAQNKNPEMIANVSWLCSLIFDFIKRQYQSTLRKCNKDEFYVWIKLNSQQIQSLKSSKGQNFMFSTFVIGSTDKSYTHPDSSYENMFRIYIRIPKDIKSFDKQIDLGFYVYQSKVIINLMNMFHIDDLSIQERIIYATYGSLASENNLRQDKNNKGFRYYRDAKKGNIRMMKLYDYYCFNRKNINNQHQLIYSLQMYQKYKEMASIFSKESNSSQQIQKIKQCIGDCELQTNNVEKAVQIYGNLKSAQRKILKKLYLYKKIKNGPKFSQTISQLNGYLKISSNYKELTKIAANNFLAEMIARNGEYEISSKKIQETIKQMVQIIKSRPDELRRQSYKYYPLYLLVKKTYANICKLKGQIICSQMAQAECQQIQQTFDGVHRIWLENLADK